VPTPFFSRSRVYSRYWGARLGVPADWIRAIIWVESSDRDVQTWEPVVEQYAWGRMQVLGTTAQQLGWEGPFEPLLNPAVGIEYGTRYMRYQIRRYGRDLNAVADAYHNGSVKGDPEYIRRVHDALRRV